MIWIIIGLVVFLVVTIKILCDSWYDWQEKLLYPLAALILSSMMTFLVLLIASGIVSDCAEIDYDMVSDTKIVALKDNQNVSGNFYIMGGYVDEDLYYYYATETQFGHKTEKVKADNTYIKYTDGETHIEKYEPKFVNDYVYLFGLPMNLSRYIVYCPENTIANDFRIDLE
jgi:hypothetical protein